MVAKVTTFDAGWQHSSFGQQPCHLILPSERAAAGVNLSYDLRATEEFLVSTEISLRDSSSNTLLEAAVFALDGWLRRRRGVFEYWLEPQCLFRLEQRRADDTLVLADGTRVRAGARVLALHLWNEHLPLMGRSGLTFAWGHKVSRAIGASLHELARYLARRSDLSDVCVLYADVRVSGANQAGRAARSLAHYGFEIVSASVDRRGAPQRIADALFVLLMAGAINPCTLRGAPMRHANLRLFISRKVLEQRYGVHCADRVSFAERPGINSAARDHPADSPESKPSDRLCIE